MMVTRANRVRLWICILVAALLAACSSESDTLPAELQGTWRTRATSHQDRYFVLHPQAIVLGYGEGSSLHPIQRVTEHNSDGTRLYELSYWDEAGEVQVWTFYHEDRHGGIIRFKNLPKVEWEKQPEN
ncbi:MAG TPA: hypothetical protein VIC04_10540 [Terriglobia bacterium]